MDSRAASASPLSFCFSSFVASSSFLNAGVTLVSVVVNGGRRTSPPHFGHIHFLSHFLALTCFEFEPNLFEVPVTLEQTPLAPAALILSRLGCWMVRATEQDADDAEEDEDDDKGLVGENDESLTPSEITLWPSLGRLTMLVRSLVGSAPLSMSMDGVGVALCQLCVLK